MLIFCSIGEPFGDEVAGDYVTDLAVTRCVQCLHDNSDGLVVQEGEELTISYIDLGLPPSARGDELRKNFFFECTCDR